MRYIFCDDPAQIGPIGGFRRPDRALALYIEGFSLPDEGFDAEPGAFDEHCMDATLVVSDIETANYLYGIVSHALRKELTDDFLDADNEAVIAYWNLGDNKAAVLAGDAGGSDNASFLLKDCADEERAEGKEVRLISATHFSINHTKEIGVDLATILNNKCDEEFL